MNDETLIVLLKTLPASTAAVFLIWKFAPSIISFFQNRNGQGNKNGYGTRLDKIDEKLTQISNHNYHELLDGLKRIEDSVERMNDNVNRNLSELKAEVSFIKARVINNHK